MEQFAPRLGWGDYAPCAEPDGGPEGIGSPRGPPRVCCLWLGTEPERNLRQAPRMVAPIRGEKAKAEINARRLPGFESVIKCSTGEFSRSRGCTRARFRKGQALAARNYHPELNRNDSSVRKATLLVRVGRAAGRLLRLHQGFCAGGDVRCAKARGPPKHRDALVSP